MKINVNFRDRHRCQMRWRDPRKSGAAGHRHQCPGQIETPCVKWASYRGAARSDERFARFHEARAAVWTHIEERANFAVRSAQNDNGTAEFLEHQNIAWIGNVPRTAGDEWCFEEDFAALLGMACRIGIDAGVVFKRHLGHVGGTTRGDVRDKTAPRGMGDGGAT
jgi:hypothetical protein